MHPNILHYHTLDKPPGKFHKFFYLPLKLLETTTIGITGGRSILSLQHSKKV